MRRYTDLTVNEICNGIISTAEKIEGMSLSELRDEFAVDENNRDDYIQRFDNAIRSLGVFCAVAGADTEVAAKAAAYDRVKQIAHEFVQRCTNGTRGILNESGLTDHLRQMEATFEAVNTPNAATSPAKYIALLEQSVQAKDAELAQLRQQIQQRDAEIAQLKAAQASVPTS